MSIKKTYPKLKRTGEKKRGGEMCRLWVMRISISTAALDRIKTFRSNIKFPSLVLAGEGWGWFSLWADHGTVFQQCPELGPIRQCLDGTSQGWHRTGLLHSQKYGRNTSKCCAFLSLWYSVKTTASTVEREWWSLGKWLGWTLKKTTKTFFCWMLM